MAKPHRPSGLKPKQPIQQAARLILEAKLAEVFAYEDAVRAGEVEGVHDMRVAMKRFREAMRLLKPVLPKRPRKKHMKWVEELNDALGTVRDPDVMTEALERLAAEAELGEVFAPLEQELAEQRQHCHEDLLRRLDAIREKQLQRRCARFIERLSERRGSDGETARRFAHHAIAERVVRVLALEEDARAPGAVEALHRMRIAVKRLKYALEPFLEILPPLARESYDQVSELQELMGEVHDCDVLDAALAAFAAAGLRERREAVQRGLEHLRRQRQELHHTTCALLDAMAEQDLPRRLLDGLD